MEPIALALAGSGFVVVTFDFLGHGRHPRPMRGDLQDQEGTPAILVEQTGEVVDRALQLDGVDGRVALLGHSMATNILVRYAQRDPRAAATVGVSMFAPTIDEGSPLNLLAISGQLERRLRAEARRVVAMVAGGSDDEIEPFTTYGSFATGSARRAAVAPRVEHVGVLYSATTIDESKAWLDAAFGRSATDSRVGRSHGRGLWIAALLAAVFVLARLLVTRLPRVSAHALGASASWARLALVAGLPALITPFLLRPMPTGFLPVVVGDYLAVHFGVFGLTMALLLWWTGGRPDARRIVAHAGLAEGGAQRVAVAVAALLVWFAVAMIWPLDRYFTSFVPVAERLPLMLAVFAGTLPYFVVDEWATRGAQARRGAYPVTKLLFLLSLALAVALDFEGLFFLVIIVPVILLFFVVHGVFSRWIVRATGSPLVAALGNAVAFAWAIGVTFPLYAGA